VNEAYLEGEAALIEQIDAQRQLVEANIAEREALYQFLSDLLIPEQSIACLPFMEDDAAIRIHDLEATL
jgi:hypothetical protein